MQRKKPHISKKTRRKLRPRKSRSKRSRLFPRLLTAPQLETMLQISRKTIYLYAARNIIPHIRIETNVRFREKDIARWIERHTYRPPSMKNVARRRRR